MIKQEYDIGGVIVLRKFLFYFRLHSEQRKQSKLLLDKRTLDYQLLFHIF